MKLTSADQLLIQAALAVQQNAYAPYSQFLVGAALRTASSTIYSGCNVENASYGLTICAERIAASQAIAAGEREFEMLAIASAKAATPCGACRQFLAEFHRELPILLIDSETKQFVRLVSIGSLLPDQFELE
jgi:cytidine deaminase